MPILEHPDLPGQPINVAECSVVHHERSGWQRQKPKKSRKTKPGSDEVQQALTELEAAGEQSSEAAEELADTIRELQDEEPEIPAQ